MSTIFGPVPSRRLGRSLGIDVIPTKTCSYDCLYCESGRTTHLSLERQVFVSPDQVIRDLEGYFAGHPEGAEVLTLSSAGEPTLYAPLGELLERIKKSFPHLPLVVLTNGSLLWDPCVRKDLLMADRVVPSLDAVSPEVFRKINRPCRGLTIDRVLEGLYAFRREYRGQLHLEILLVSQCNDTPDELRKLASEVERINPDHVELNTVARPPAFPGVVGLTEEAMQAACSHFPGSRTRVIGSYRPRSDSQPEVHLEERIMDLVGRRPCTLVEMADSLGASVTDVQQSLQRLMKSNSLKTYRLGTDDFYVSEERGIESGGNLICAGS
jgi:wyosine [tRNA(Phe)-imidazoG37] synthetase (radical SAM superfamily)